MAVVSHITCGQCGVNAHVSHGSGKPPPKLCGLCERKNAEDQKDAALAELAALPTDERLRRIEAWIYDHSHKYHAPYPARF